MSQAKLREALRKYGSHLLECSTTRGGARCTCGFDAALSEQTTAESGSEVAEIVDRLVGCGRTLERYEDPRLKPLSRENFIIYDDARKQIVIAKRQLIERLSVPPENNSEPVAHDCVRCRDEAGGWPRYMIVCPTCGNKRCPKASDHRLECTGSNEPGQAGSVYAYPASPEPVANALQAEDGGKT